MVGTCPACSSRHGGEITLRERAINNRNSITQNQLRKNLKMGILFSRLSSAQAEPPPSVVLVPPFILLKEERGRSRFAKSAYETCFHQPSLRALFSDYLDVSPIPGIAVDFRGSFRPPEDPRLSVSTSLQTPHTGTLTFRFEPNPEQPYTFLDVKAKILKDDTIPSSKVLFRGCALFPSKNISIFGAVSSAAFSGGKEGSVKEETILSSEGMNTYDAMHCGIRYASPRLSVGSVCAPLLAGDSRCSFGTSLDRCIAKSWMVGRWGPFLIGMQAQKGDISYSLAYSSSFRPSKDPSASSKHPGRGFTAIIEMIRGTGGKSQLSLSFLHRMTIQRRVHNLLERRDVVGISNYLDVGLQMVTGTGSSGGVPGDMRIGGSWQVNKNLLVKGNVGTGGVHAACVLRSWCQPAVTVGVSVGHSLSTADVSLKEGMRYGLTVSVQSWKSLLYERALEKDKFIGSQVTQRHQASQEDHNLARGEGLLVPLDRVEDPLVLGLEHGMNHQAASSFL